MMVNIETVITLELVVCCTCGILFGLPALLDQTRRDDKKLWHCPNGHSQHYGGKPVRDLLSEAEGAARLLREELAVAEAAVSRKSKQVATLKRRAKQSPKEKRTT